jgi:hypothetical protein
VKESDKAKLTYTGNETLTFFLNGKDTVVFEGQGLSRYLELISGTGGDCPGPDQQREKFQAKYVSTTPPLVLYFTYGVPDNSQIGLQVNFSVSGASFYSGGAGLTVPIFKDSLFVANKLYQGVVLFTTSDDIRDSLYYNQEYGIIRMVTNKYSNVWEILTN